MKRRRRRIGAGVIVRAIHQQGDRIVAAIEKASASQNLGREAMIRLGAEILRGVMDEGAKRVVVVNPGTGRSVTFTGNDTGGRDNEEPPPESGPRK